MASCCAPHQNEENNNVAHTTDCCATTGGQAERSIARRVQQCPACEKKGKAVAMETVKAMLAVTLHEIQPNSHYLFCRSAECPVVYFADDGKQTFTERELRGRVHQKHPNDANVFVCYCFRHTPGTIQAELLKTGVSTVVDEITAGIKAGQCACEIRNPQGSCCLGNVTATVRQAQAALLSVSAD